MARKRGPSTQQPATTGPARTRRECVLQPECLEDIAYWVETERRIARRVLDLMQHVLRDPFSGIGKPEPLKGFGADVWSRRITQEHRLVYRVADDRVDFLMARYHY